MLERIAKDLNIDAELVSRVIDHFALSMHRGFAEYKGSNGDYVGEQLRLCVSPMAWYHLLGVFHLLATRYEWDEHATDEYLAHCGASDVWEPYRKQCAGWAKPRA